MGPPTVYGKETRNTAIIYLDEWGMERDSWSAAIKGSGSWRPRVRGGRGCMAPHPTDDEPVRRMGHPEANRSLMAEMADAGEGHGEAEAVGGGDYFRVADGAAGLDYGGGAGFGDGLQTVGEREKCVRSGDAIGER